MTFAQDMAACFTAAAGCGAPALDRAAFDAALVAAGPILRDLQEQAASVAAPSLLALPERRDDLEALAPIAARWRTAFDTVIVLGTGGSALGGRALHALHECPIGLGPGGKSPPPRVIFLDNSDPVTFEQAMGRVDQSKTGFIVISKSGGTAETLAQAVIAWRALIDRLDDQRVRRHFLVITEPRDTALRGFAERRGVPVLDHPTDLGGRYSCLSLVGLLPAMIAGLDAEAVRAGATHALHDLTGARSSRLAAEGAALNVAAMRGGRNIAVLMPYCDRLRQFTFWWRQLWAESLGKQGCGSTPAPALGAVDQHSQLQLYLDGPDDKLFTVLTVAGKGLGGAIDAEGLDGRPEWDWLAGRALGDLIDAQARATVETLRAAGRPVRLIRLGRLAEAELGLLMMHFMLETVIAARILGLDPFDQPAVEAGKIRTRALMMEGEGAPA